MKAVMLSIKPNWCELIASGKKTVEVRKTRPKIDTPFKCYIYETKGKTEIPTFIDEEGHEIYEGRGQVIGEFVCDKIDIITVLEIATLINGIQDDSIYKTACISREEIEEYINYEFGTEYYGNKAQYGKNIYGWHISDLIIYDEPKELMAFHKPCLNEAPCSICRYAELNFCDESLECQNLVFNAPQSWCYVEELK